jgi:hypothetical protein
MRELTVEQQRAVLAFATSSSRAPLLGFKYLHPMFTIARQFSDSATEVHDDDVSL